MKRLVIVVLLLAAVALAIVATRDSSKPPRFVKDTFPRYSHNRVVRYFGGETQIVNDRLWIFAQSASSNHCFLLDVKNRAVIGELMDGWPVALNSNATAVLCVQHKPYQRGLLDKIRETLQRLSLGAIAVRPPLATEVLWLVNLTNNSAVKLGRVLQQPGSTTRVIVSPDHRYVVKPSGISNSEVFLCDLERQITVSMALPGIPLGWWTERSLLLMVAGDYILFDIHAKAVSSLLTEDQIESFLETEGIQQRLSQIKRHFVRRGLLTDIYLETSGEQDKGILIKLERQTGVLKIVRRSFDEKGIAGVDPSGQYFLVRIRGKNVGGVHLEHIATGGVRTLVPADESSRSTRPFFAGDAILYARSNMLWKIDLEGSTNVLLFPPAN